MKRTALFLSVLLLAAAASAQWFDGAIHLPDSFGYLGSPQGIVENPLTGRLYIDGSFGVLVVDAATGEKVTVFRYFSLPVYCPGTGRLCMFAGDSVIVVDATADTVVGADDFVYYVERVVYSPVSQRVYAYSQSSWPVVIEALDVPTATVVSRADFQGYIDDAVWDSATNRIFFAAYGDNDSGGVLAFECDGDSFGPRAWYEEPGAGHVALDPELRKLYRSQSTARELIVLDPATLAETGRAPCEPVLGAMFLEPVGHRLLWWNGSGTVVFDCRGDTVRAELDSLEPFRMDRDPSNGEVFVAPTDLPGIAVIDLGDSICRHLLVERGNEIEALALSQDRSLLYAGLALDTLFFVDPQTGTVEETVVAPYLRATTMVYNPAGNELYVLCYNKSVVAVIEPDRQLSHVIEGLPYEYDALAVLNPVLNRLYVGDDSTLWVVDCNTKRVISTHELPWFDEPSFVLLADRGQLYIFPRSTDSTAGNVVWMYDCWADSLVPALTLPCEAPHAVFHPAAGLVYFCVDDTAPALRALDPNTNRVVRELDIARPDARDRLAVDIDRDRLYFSSWRDDRLLVLDAVSGTVLDSVDLERQVDTIIMNHAQDKLYLLRLSTSGRFFRYDCVGDSLLPELDYDPSHVALLNTRNNKLYFDWDDGLRAVDCRHDSIVGDWSEGDGTRYLAWNAIDNLVYASRRGAEIYVFADSPTGVSEDPPAVVRRSGPTVVRGVLMLAGREPARLLDVTGRHVLELAPGSNDLRGLAPGVYFLKVEGGRLKDEPGSRAAVRKVIVQR